MSPKNGAMNNILKFTTPETRVNRQLTGTVKGVLFNLGQSFDVGKVIILVIYI